MDNERIPTMPQTQERIPTMPQGEVRIPTMPQGGQGRIATLPQENGNGRVATVPQGKNNGATRANINSIIVQQNITFIGDKGNKCTIDAKDIISKDSGESQIYGCSCEGSKEKYVARVLISVTPDSDIEKINSRNKVIEFLDKAYKNSSSHILPLVDHSIITINNKEYYVEVYPYCKGGDLGTKKGKISYKEIKNDVVPAINEALKEFHDAGLVHRDVKPENLYKYKGKIVLGDFGITCDLREDGFATDKYKTGTLGYYAPELMSQAAIKASDYYSFGQTIWTLYSGEMMYQNILRRYSDYGIEEQRTQVNFAMLNNVYYGLEEIKKDDSFLEVLIKGLLKYDPTARYDYETVNRWIKEDKTLLKTESSSSNGDFATPFRYNGVEYWNNEDIYNILVSNWENAKELLYSGALKEFYKKNDYGIASEIDKIVKAYSGLSGNVAKKATDEEIEVLNDIGMSKFFFALNKGGALVWQGEQYNSFIEISNTIGTMIDGEKVNLKQKYSDLLASELLGYWYKMITSDNGAYDKAMSEAIENIQLLADADNYFENEIAYTATYYLFMENEENIVYRDCYSVDDLVNKLVDYQGDIYSYMKEIINSPLFYGFLLAQGYYDSAINMINNNSESEYDSFELLFNLLFTQVQDINILSKLSKLYVDKGPKSYLVWWKNNLNLYEFKGTEALKLKEEIEKVNLSSNNVTQIRERLEELNKLSIRFKGMFVNNIFLRNMGLTKGKKDIVSDKLEAYWHYDFLGNEVPIGFGKYICCD